MSLTNNVFIDQPVWARYEDCDYYPCVVRLSSLNFLTTSRFAARPKVLQFEKHIITVGSYFVHFVDIDEYGWSRDIIPLSEMDLDHRLEYFVDEEEKAKVREAYEKVKSYQASSVHAECQTPQYELRKRNREKESSEIECIFEMKKSKDSSGPIVDAQQFLARLYKYVVLL